VIVAVALPALYLQSRLGELTTQAERWVSNQRIWRAWQLTTALVDVGSRRPIFDRMPEHVAASLETRLNELLTAVSTPLADNPSDKLRLARARQLAALDEYNSAEAVLANLPQRIPSAALLLGAIQQEQNQWLASNESCHGALELIERSRQSDDQSAAMQWQACDALCGNFERLQLYSNAEAVLMEALDTVPQCSTQIHLRLAEHYRTMGRTEAAMDQLLAARHLSGSNSTAIDRAIEQLHAGTAGCLLFYTPPPAAIERTAGH
jgi:tetratricopeptide (TPR) repeat protein